MRLNRHAVLGLAAALATLTLAACGERRDIADLAANLAPYDQLRGMNIAELRAGQVRAMRRGIERAPLEGYRETLGDWDLVYTVQGYDGTGDESWPREDVQVLEIEATRQMDSDSAAMEAWRATAAQVRNVTGATPRCLTVQGTGFSLSVIEFDRGGSWRLAVTYAPSLRLRNKRELSARTAVAVRRFSLQERFPKQGDANPDSLPTWTAEEAECKLP